MANVDYVGILVLVFHVTINLPRADKNNWAIFVFGPNGHKFRSNDEIKNFLEKNPSVKCDLDVTNTCRVKKLYNSSKKKPKAMNLKRDVIAVDEDIMTIDVEIKKFLEKNPSVKCELNITNTSRIRRLQVSLKKAQSFDLKKYAIDVNKDIITLDEDIVTVKEDIITVDEDIITVKEDIMIVKEDIITVKEDIITHDEEIITVKEDIITVKEDIITVEEDINTVDEDIITIDEDINGTNSCVPKLKGSNSNFAEWKSKLHEKLHKFDKDRHGTVLSSVSKIKESNSEFVECKDGLKENIESENDIEDPLKMTENSANLKTHVNSAHEGKESHVCFICKSSFRFKQRLTRHIRDTHQEGTCSLCNITFSNVGNLSAHISSVHEGKKSTKRVIKSSWMDVTDSSETEG